MGTRWSEPDHPGVHSAAGTTRREIESTEKIQREKDGLEDARRETLAFSMQEAGASLPGAAFPPRLQMAQSHGETAVPADV